MVELGQEGVNWSREFGSIVGATTSGMTQAFRAFNFSSGNMLQNLEGVAKSVFRSILDAFLDMVAKMVAKAAIFGVLNVITGGAFGGIAGGFGSFMGFARGGYTGDGPRDQVAGLVHKGEFVLPASVVDGIRRGSAPSMAMAGAGGGVTITNNISLSGGSGDDVSRIMSAITEACRKGVRQAGEMSNAVVKTGNTKSGRAVL